MSSNKTSFSKTDLIGLAAGYGVLAVAGAAQPELIPFLLIGGAVGGVIALIGHYVKCVTEKRRAVIQYTQADSNCDKSELEQKLKSLGSEIEGTEGTKETNRETNAKAVQFQKLEVILGKEGKKEEFTFTNVPTIVKTPNGWNFIDCVAPRRKNFDVYNYVKYLLRRNQNVLLTRNGSLLEIEEIDENAEFYFDKNSNKIYVVSKKVPSVVENWNVFGASYVILGDKRQIPKDSIPKDSIQLNSVLVIEGKFDSETINVQMFGRPATLENSNDILNLLSKGLTLYVEK